MTLYGAVKPFSASTLADSRGHFRFRNLDADTYTVAVFVPASGEARQTIEVGPGTAGKGGRVEIVLDLKDSQFVRPRGGVSVKELSIPDRARREYEEAQKRLARRDIEGATERLRKAVEIAPQFANAWNNLGTIAYQTRQYAQAEEYFRKALEQDSQAYEPLVNLGGVLLTLGKVDDALRLNLYAVLARPNDPLANSQLGMSYFAAGNYDLAQKYLKAAKRLDPAHFSLPQLTLAEVHLRRGERSEAADELEDLLRRHPDYPNAAKVREAIRKLRGRD